MTTSFLDKMARSKSKTDERPTVSTASLLNDRRTLVILPASRFDVDPEQPRKHFEQAEIDELRTSIEMRGQIQPIVVFENKDEPGRYRIIAGERRHRAVSESDKVSDLIAYVVDPKTVINPDDVLLMQLDENIRRSNLSVVEIAGTYQKLIDTWNVSQDEAAERLNITKVTLSKYLSVLKAPTKVQSASTDGLTQDLDTLYALTLASQRDENSVVEFIDTRSKTGNTANIRADAIALKNETRGQSKKKRAKKKRSASASSFTVNTLSTEKNAKDGVILVCKDEKNNVIRLTLPSSAKEAMSEAITLFD